MWDPETIDQEQENQSDERPDEWSNVSKEQQKDRSGEWLDDVVDTEQKSESKAGDPEANEQQQQQQDQSEESHDNSSDAPKEQQESNAELDPMGASNEHGDLYNASDEWNDYESERKARFELKPFKVPIKGTNINDLNDDCLEAIFEQLSVWELLKVAETCTNLLRVARLTFSRRCGQCQVVLKYNGPELLIENPNGPQIYKLGPCLRVLGSFGETITRLNFRSAYMFQYQSDAIHAHLNQYCSETLVELRYEGKDLMKFTKPFKKVERVEICSSNFFCEWFDIITCFPNLRNLKLNPLNNPECIAMHFPKLESFEVHLNVHNSRPENFTTSLLMNKQLRDLQVYGFGFDVVFFKSISDFERLENLSTVGDFHNIGLRQELDNIKLKSVFQINRGVMDGLISSNVSIEFDQLEKLTILGRLDENVIKFIESGWMHTMSKLTCSTPDMVIDRNILLEFAEQTPLLSEFDCSSAKFLADDVIEYLKICSSSLKRFTFKLTERNDFSRIQVSLSPGWRSSMDDKCVTSER